MVISGFANAKGKLVNKETTLRICRRTIAWTSSALLAGALIMPAPAWGIVTVDDAELAQGENSVGGGTATLGDATLDMVDVTAGSLYTDESLQIGFEGGNEIGNVEVAGSAEVGMDFSGSNEVEEVHARDDASVTINANGNNEFEEVEAHDRSNVTINVTDENDFEEIAGYDDANVAVRGTSCQRRDIVNLGEDEEDTALATEGGGLTIGHVTVNLLADENAVGSEKGDVVIDTSKIAASDDDQYVLVDAGGNLLIRESVLDFAGTVHSGGEMTIDHSDVKVTTPDEDYEDSSPYRVWSDSNIELIREKNGEVKEGKVGDKSVRYVDTGDDKEVDLKADGEPGYYRCKGDDDDGVSGAKAGARIASLRGALLPATGDGQGVAVAAACVLAGATGVYVSRRHRA